MTSSFDFSSEDSVVNIPVDTQIERIFNVQKTFRMSSERLMYVQFTSCVYEDVNYIVILYPIAEV